MIGLVLWTVLFIYSVKSLSVCDDIDNSFVIDQDSLLNNGDGVIDFIESIMEHGSSEDAAFSIHLYGNDINFDQDINLLEMSLLDTFNQHRSGKTQIILNRLQEIIQNISIPTSISNIKTTISLIDAFESASKQDQPTRYVFY